MGILKLLASLAIQSGAPMMPTHRAGTPPRDAELPHADGPWFRPVGNGCVEFADEWQEIVWEKTGFVVRIPRGYVSDGYSIPRLAWIFAGHPFGQEHMIPAFVHDYLCDIAQSYEERVLADAVFFHLMKKYEIPAWKQAVFYILVRFWGRYMWKLRGGGHA
jgi:hypothetical protein